jgi:RNA polymerase sigma-70 factor (ECF subfamily)
VVTALAQDAAHPGISVPTTDQMLVGLPSSHLSGSRRLRARFAVVNGGPGIVMSRIDGRPTAVLAFTVADGLIVEIAILTDPRRLTAPGLAR